MFPGGDRASVQLIGASGSTDPCFRAGIVRQRRSARRQRRSARRQRGWARCQRRQARGQGVQPLKKERRDRRDRRNHSNKRFQYINCLRVLRGLRGSVIRRRDCLPQGTATHRRSVSHQWQRCVTLGLYARYAYHPPARRVVRGVGGGGSSVGYAKGGDRSSSNRDAIAAIDHTLGSCPSPWQHERPAGFEQQQGISPVLEPPA